jgi:hypothetical protein
MHHSSSSSIPSAATFTCFAACAIFLLHENQKEFKEYARRVGFTVHAADFMWDYVMSLKNCGDGSPLLMDQTDAL